MLKAKRKTVITSLVAMIGVLVGALSVSLTWFAKMNSIDDLEIGGSVLKQYFDSGTGTQADPFVITRPKHWENLVWLHNNVSNFYQAITEEQVDPQQQNDQGYYFQVGKQIDGQGQYYVYDYTDEGLINPNNSSMNSRTLNLNGLDSLIPIGCDTKPFLGVINGHGITVSGFDVLGFEDKNYNLQHEEGEDGFNDVGIFGYIGNDSAVNNLYFNDFRIHLANASAIRSNNSGLHNNTLHASVTNGSNDTCFVGYIAGHMHYSSSVTGVYINNCSIVGGTAAKSGYGFFGVVENQNGESRPTPLEEITEIKQAGEENNFGGSIDMLGVFERLQLIYDEATNQLMTNELVVEDSITNKVESYGLDYRDSYSWASGVTSPVAYKYIATDLGGEFTFPDDNDGVGSSTVTNDGTFYYQCLFGTSSDYPKTVTKYVLLDDWYDCFYISNGNNYLNHRYFSQVQNEKGEEHAAGWNFDNANHLWVKVLGTVYYLNQVNGTLVTDTSATTTWTETDEGEIYTVIDGLNYYIDFEDAWCLSPYFDRYTINDGNGNYLKVNYTDNYNFDNATSEDNASKFFFSNHEGATTLIGFNHNNTIYYLGNDNEKLSFSSSPTTWNKDEDGYYVVIQGIKYYLVYEYSTWRLMPEDGIKIRSGNNNYLNLTNGEFTNNQNGDSVIWHIISSENEAEIYCIYNGQKLYLSCSNGKLLVSPTSMTWTMDNGAIYATSNDVDYYLTYQNGWKLIDLHFYRIQDNSGNYLVATDDSFTNTRTQNDATHFYFLDETQTYPRGPIRYAYDGELYYLNLSISNGVGTLESTDSSNSTIWLTDNNSIYYQEDGITYYLECDTDRNWVIRRYANAGYISDGTNYLAINNNDQIINTTDQNAASLFVFSNSGTNPSGTIQLLGTNKYLLNASGTNLSCNTSNSPTIWSNDTDNIYNGSYYLQCLNGNWILSTTVYSGYFISRNGYYLNANGTSWANSETPVTLWSATSGQIYIVGTNYYLYSNTGNPPTISINNGSGVNWTNNGALYYRPNNGYYRYCISDINADGVTGERRTSNPSGTTYAITFTAHTCESNGIALTNTIRNTIAVKTNVSTPTVTVDNYESSKNGGSTFSYTKDYSLTFTQTSLQNCQKTIDNQTFNGGYTTYFPLRVDKDDNGNYPNGYAASDKNTGYVVSGFNLGSGNGDYQRQYGDIRVSGYPIGNIFNSYSTSTKKITNVYTINDSGSITNITNTSWASDSNYTQAKNALQTTLSGVSADPENIETPPYNQYQNNTVFGLHFMDATISTNNLIHAKKAKVLGKTYYNYELPEDSIDFNVNKRGQISFFAGNYYTGNQAFFSLHKIFRDSSNRITAIKEIKEVYWHTQKKDKRNYIYRFEEANGTSTYTNANGTYTGETNLDGEYSSVFKTSRITNPTTNLSSSSSSYAKRLFYFAIPCNKGEYALGSVAGKTGAYLCYLDIAANGGDPYLEYYKEPETATTFNVDFRSASDTSSYCTIEIGTEMPTSIVDSNLEIRVVFDNSPSTVTAKYPNGLYKIYVTNKTGVNLQLSVLLIDDDDDLYNLFGYAYQIIYTNNDHTDTVLNGQILNDDETDLVTVPFWKRMAVFDIPSSGAADEHQFDDEGN